MTKKTLLTKPFSRRTFLKGTGVTAAALAASRFSFPVLAQGATLNMITWGAFIPTVDPLVTQLVSAWASNNGADVDISFTGFDQLADTVATAVATNSGPDIAMLLYAEPHQFAGSLVDVSDVATEVGENMGGWFNAATESCLVDGVWRALPFFSASHAMVYREDLLTAVGASAFPETWDELLNVGTQLKAAGTPIGLSYGRAKGDGNNFLYSLMWSHGAFVWDEAGNLALDSAETRTALEFARELYEAAMDPGVLAWDDGANNRAFLAGEVSVTNNASSILWAARDTGVDFASSVNHAAYPAGPNGRVLLVQTHNLGIMNYTPDVDKAKDLLRYLGSSEFWSSLAPEGFAFIYPLFKGLEDDPAMPWNTDPKLEAFKGLGDSSHIFGYPGPVTALASEVANNFIILDMFNAVASGDVSVDDAVSMAVEAIEDLM